MMKVIQPCTRLERVVLTCSEIAVEFVHCGTCKVNEVKPISPSDTAAGRRRADTTAGAKEYFFQKVFSKCHFDIDLEENINIIVSESQLVVFCKCPNLVYEGNRILEHYFFCPSVRESVNVVAIFGKVN